MTFRIPKGQHHAWPPPFRIYYDRKVIERIVEFDISAKYDFGNADNNDVNKLFGIGYFNGGHHEDSARFGWNWNAEESKVTLFHYCYNQGVRSFKKICDVSPYRKVLLIISICYNRYSFLVHDAHNTWHRLGESESPRVHNKKLGYQLGCYFGGNNPAPHDIRIKISKK